MRATHPDGKVHGVVAAIGRDDGRWLIVRRSKHVAAPLSVCFPGGGIEMGETPEDALVREIREELSLDITVQQLVWEWHGKRPEYELFLRGYMVSASQEVTPDPAEIAEVLWLTLEEAETHPDALETNREFCDAIRAYVEGK